MRWPCRVSPGSQRSARDGANWLGEGQGGRVLPRVGQGAEPGPHRRRLEQVDAQLGALRLRRPGQDEVLHPGARRPEGAPVGTRLPPPARTSRTPLARQSLASSTGPHVRISRHAAVRLAASTVSQSLGWMCGAGGQPAERRRRRGRGCRDARTARRARDRRCRAHPPFASSSGSNVASPPTARTWSSTSASAPSVRARSTTRAPRRASSTAHAAPRPRLAPVTSATRLSRLRVNALLSFGPSARFREQAELAVGVVHHVW